MWFEKVRLDEASYAVRNFDVLERTPILGVKSVLNRDMSAR
jgi:hypothetical protein